MGQALASQNEPGLAIALDTSPAYDLIGSSLLIDINRAFTLCPVKKLRAVDLVLRNFLTLHHTGHESWLSYFTANFFLSLNHSCSICKIQTVWPVVLR